MHTEFPRSIGVQVNEVSGDNSEGFTSSHVIAKNKSIEWMQELSLCSRKKKSSVLNNTHFP